MRLVLDYLEDSAERFPDKIAVRDEKTQCTYRELKERSMLVAGRLAGVTAPRTPVVIFMDKSVETLTCFLGTVYAGCFYVLVDPSFPAKRIVDILGVLEADVVVTKEEYRSRLRQECGFSGTVLTEKDFVRAEDMAEEGRLRMIREQALDTDPLYGIFTSGSTGTPKGVIISHASVLDFIDHFTELFDITQDDVIGNQAPFDFDVSVKDIYSCLKTGATLVLIPRAYFMFPNQVVDMLEECGVTTLIWAVSALCLLNRMHGLSYKVPSRIRKIMFSGEMMPVKQLNQWRAHYPDAMFVNLYGPTEITCNCMYYIVDREFSEEERLPMGRTFPNEKVFLLTEDGREVTKEQPGVQAEVCVAGRALALGYYNNQEMTAKAFTVNPLNTHYPERIYHTGDLAAYREDGHLYFMGRKDFQIKHMGHRIELEEIEAALGSLPAVDRACCFFDEKKNKIVAAYCGSASKKEIVESLREKVPLYMIPNVFLPKEELPLTKNGKTDRAAIKASCQRSQSGRGERHGA